MIKEKGRKKERLIKLRDTGDDNEMVAVRRKEEEKEEEKEYKKDVKDNDI